MSEPGGTYSTPQSITLSDSTTGAKIYYTTDGSTPGKASTQYTNPINVAGTETINAIALSPGGLYSPVTTATYTLPPVVTSTTLTASTTNGDESQTITLTATVTGTNPTGTVTFSAGSQSLGTATVTAGVATLQTSFATAGTYTVTAAYSGDGGNAVSTSSAITITIAAPSFATSASPASQTISPGQTASFTFSVTPAGGYTGTVKFSCGTLPSEASCAFSPSSVSITGGTAGSTKLTISTTASTTASNKAPANPFGPWSTAGGTVLAGIVGLAFGPRRTRRWNRMLRALLCVALLAAVWLPLAGCGGGGNNGGGGGGSNPGTPSGTYTVSVTAADSAGGGSNAVSVKLVVQ